jgi:hypothetical protein
MDSFDFWISLINKLSKKSKEGDSQGELAERKQTNLK